MSRTAASWLRCVGAAARAFADMADAELAAPEPSAKPAAEPNAPAGRKLGAAQPTELTATCPFCQGEAKRAPASGPHYFRCTTGGHLFDRLRDAPALTSRE